MCLVHSKSSINGNHSHQSPVPLLILLDGNCSSFLINPETEACFWAKFLSVSSKANSAWAPRIATKWSFLWAETKPERWSLEIEPSLPPRGIWGWRISVEGERKLTYLTLEDYQILLSLVKGKFTPFEISKQSETSSEFLIFSNLKNDINKNEEQQTRIVQEKNMATCFCLWLDSQWGSGTYSPCL